MALLPDSSPPPRTHTLAPWLAAASEGAVLLTSNRRAARFLRERFALQMRAEGREGWPTPAILTLDGWLREAWQQLPWADGFAGGSATPVLLNNGQEHALWMQTIAARQDSSPLNLEALADLAMQAWVLLHDYGGTAASLRSSARQRVDWQRFKEWCAHFSDACLRDGWTTRAELTALLTGHLQTGQWSPAKRVVLWGFDKLTPAQQKLVEALASVAKVEEVAADLFPGEEGSGACRIEVKAPADEYRAAAKWAALRLQAKPEARLAILTTKAAEDRGALSRALSLKLDAAQFDFSLGHPLAHLRLVRQALKLLRWPSQALAAVEVGDLLLAPELCTSPMELRERAMFEAERFRRRSTVEPSMHLAAFSMWLEREIRGKEAGSLARLQRQCEAAQKVIPPKPPPMTAEDWAARFRGVLAAFDYPSQTDSSEGFQTKLRWEQLLDEFASLSLGGEHYLLSEALQTLDHLAAATVFQPESKASGVTVMGPLEAAGSFFDGIFFLGCTEDRWPLPERMSPLLPVDLQRSLGMPGALRGASLREGQRMTSRILRSAQEVIFSHAARAQDGEVRPSPVLGLESVAPAGAGLAAELVVDAVPPECGLQSFADTAAAPWTETRGTVPSSLLGAQAACPFKAFALHRLRARGEDFPEEGLDNMQRGQLTHKLLQEVWAGEDGLGSSEGLRLRIEAGTLEEFVRAKADLVVRDAEADGWQREFLAIERERLSALVCRWLCEVESQRTSFVVKAAESERSFTLNDVLTFRVRLDRVDALVDGSGAQGDLVLLDYKSGNLSRKAWDAPRMDEPQMPLYALHALKDVEGNVVTPSALAFASLKGPKLCLQGMADRDGILAMTKSSSIDTAGYWQAMEKWHTDIENMAYEFVTGEACVHPKHGSTTCKYCELQPLCRVHQTPALLNGADDEGPND